MYKIYINDNILILKDTQDVQKNDFPDGSLLAPYNGKVKTLFSYIDMLEKSASFRTVVLHFSDIKQLWKDFKSLFNIIKASGGVVRNENEQLLFIFRRGLWDLPKGKIEKNEKKKAAALREVEEETSVKKLTLETNLTKTWHVYRTNSKKRVLKKTYWYIMQAPKQKLIPQAKEDITEAKWMSLEKFEKSNLQTYASILEVLNAYSKQGSSTL